MKLPDHRKDLKGCTQTINGANLSKEYSKLYDEYSKLYDKNETELKKIKDRLDKNDETVIRKWGQEENTPGQFAFFEMGMAKGKLSIINELLDNI